MEARAKSTAKFEISFEPLLDKQYLMGEDRSAAGFTVKLARTPYPFFTNTFLPTGLLTIISFIGFVIPVDLVPGRMALLVTIFLMLVNINTTERNRGPIVSFKK